MGQLSLSILPKAGWKKLDRGDRHSTIANFAGGYKQSNSGTELLIWAGPTQLYGVAEDGEIIKHPDEAEVETDAKITVKEGTEFEGVWDGHTVNDEYTHLVEYHPGGEHSEQSDSKLCTSLEKASQIIEETITEGRWEGMDSSGNQADSADRMCREEATTANHRSPLVVVQGGENTPSWRNREQQASLLAKLAEQAIQEAITEHGVRPSNLRLETNYHQSRTEPQCSYGEVKAYSTSRATNITSDDTKEETSPE